MKKRNLLVIALLVVGITASIAAPAGACEAGCTPGYWKQPQHFDSWVGYAPGADFNAVFGVGPHITLLQALNARGGGENAFLRHAVAALLNANALPDDYWPEYIIRNWVNFAYATGLFEMAKNEFEWGNELGCPLD